MTRHFDSFDAYSEYYSDHDHEYNDVDIVENDDSTAADGEFQCKSWKTAIKRLAKATGWSWVLGELECDQHSENLHTDCDSVSITAIDDGVWYVAARQYKQSTTEILAKAADIINARKGRSAWDRGVNDYALELLDNLADLTPDDLADPEAVRRALLNGADTWERYSYGGCALIYDCDIAARLCTPSELRRCKGGDLNPNSREIWLDVQARALFQAACSVRLALCAAVKFAQLLRR